MSPLVAGCCDRLIQNLKEISKDCKEPVNFKQLSIKECITALLEIRRKSIKDRNLLRHGPFDILGGGLGFFSKKNSLL